MKRMLAHSSGKKGHKYCSGRGSDAEPTPKASIQSTSNMEGKNSPPMNMYRVGSGKQDYGFCSSKGTPPVSTLPAHDDISENMCRLASGKDGYDHYSAEKSPLPEAQILQAPSEISSPKQSDESDDIIASSMTSQEDTAASLLSNPDLLLRMLDISSGKDGYLFFESPRKRGGTLRSSVRRMKNFFENMFKKDEAKADGKSAKGTKPKRKGDNSVTPVHKEAQESYESFPNTSKRDTINMTPTKVPTASKEPVFVRDRDLVMRMLKREQSLRMCEDTQKLYDCPERGDAPSIPPSVIEDSIQMQVLREHMILPTAENLHWYRCLNGMYLNDPEVRACIVYMNEDKSREGDLRAGHAWPDVTLRTLSDEPIKLADLYKDRDKPLVLIGGSGS